jgi:hypothetical protein
VELSGETGNGDRHGQPADSRSDDRAAWAARRGYVGADEEWKKFSNCAGVPSGLWRGWTDIDQMPAIWSKPRISFGMDITDEGIKPEAYDILQILLEAGADIKRFRECRVCQRLFWSARLDKKGGPFGCSPGCNNILYQRTFREAGRP